MREVEVEEGSGARNGGCSKGGRGDGRQGGGGEEWWQRTLKRRKGGRG